MNNMHWLCDDDYSEVVMKWLQDSAISRKLSDEHRKWVKSSSSKSAPDADLLEHIAKFLAYRWLQSSEWNLGEQFSFIHGYLTKVRVLRPLSLIHCSNEVLDCKPKGFVGGKINL
jgi:hypothetical protein